MKASSARASSWPETNRRQNRPRLIGLKATGKLVWDTINASFINGDSLTQGAALAYYTVFAIAPLFVITLAIAGFCFGEDTAHRELFGQMDQLLGQDGGKAIEEMVAAANKSRSGFLATAIATVTLMVAATGVFVQLQNSLNRIWNVQHSPGRGLRTFIRHRLLSFAMVFGLGFLLLVSLIVSAALTAFGDFLGRYVSGQAALLQGLELAFSLATITVLFTIIFKFLPDVKIAWRDVWLGGFLTAILFEIGKYLIGFYIAKSTLASVYGGMGSLIIVLLWVYYSSQIVFFGAQFTRLYAGQFGTKPRPLTGAKLVTVAGK
jgi:membrane protein